ncbi:uncharacterized protein E0L32_001121 [Thyridium curvatum]|uniref:Major facilitator superfamily (MFS) profile domain-containing protein n=1 Tax=Thyridium curvatum TaxID=1093900 RepID=A0A507AU90_9PEZI|nr:uncharacterized protein E0L32_001121 [Thyridium curvatum]TPX11303.1 hypothetical protein E0L32_001121 [Thyridium curvatum]
MSSAVRYLYHESGLSALVAAGPDAWLIILSRSTRMFAYGGSALVLALLLAALNVSEARIGLFMTLTLLGDVVLSLCTTLVADQLGRRATLIGGSLLMICSGVVFALCDSYLALLVAAIVGIVSATGGDIGPFRAVEESTLSGLSGPESRADVLVWYVTMSGLGSAAGTAACGQFVEWLRKKDGWELVDAYHACFWVYVLMGAISGGSTMLLSKRCELSGEQALKQEAITDENDDDDDDDETGEPFIEGQQSGQTSRGPAGRDKKGWLAQISRETRSVMYALWFLLMVDSLADGMTSMALTTYYIELKFHPTKSLLGGVLSAAYFIASCSAIFAGPLSRRIGLVSTMVFTHIPSSAAVLFFPLPQGIALTFALLLLRIGLNNMDQAPRTALIAAVVRPEERTAVMGITSMLRTLAMMTGPSITGLLAGNDQFWIAFVVAGALRLAYDLGLFVMFINIKLHKHETTRGTESAGHYALVEQQRHSGSDDDDAEERGER